ncbi:VCBS repeat-containing protein [Streptomyces genisteinicus]|uniref:VCBS repeat-containing protein n=1 Tax=Streptomyces genisteinicus TaxID=2768068 RepID=UPI001CA7ADF2|nr:VCBS repeat-containing protein [Streptomyces genisteinicus]
MNRPTRPQPRAARRRTALAASAAVLALSSLGLAPGATAAAAACPGAESDFNGDGIRDTAVADPEATVTGHARAGLVRIVYGGGKGTYELSQDAPGIPGGAEAGDRYGFALAVYDADLDGCADLAVGAPYEDISTNADAGAVHIVYGSAAGFNGGRAPKEHLQGAGTTIGGAAEPGDWLGWALVAGRTSAGTPYLVAGVPGESTGLTSAEDAGGFVYIHGTAQTVVGVISQDVETGGAVPGVSEVDDRFGASLAATPTHFAVGSPGEGVGTAPFAGGVAVFSHTLVSGHPKPLVGMAQDQAAVAGAEEPGDGFGTALAMVPYRPSGATSTTEVLLAVGSPGEDLNTTVDAGAVQVFRISASGAFTETMWVEQNTADVEQEGEAGDFFGQRLAAVNTSPNTTTTGTTARLAIGVPGEESAEEHREKGGVHIVPMVGAPGVSDAWIDPGWGIPGTPAPLQLAGLSLSGSTAGLYVGMPYGAEGHAVHLFPWNTANGGAPGQSFRPGEGGIPAGDTAFGATVR